jgi:predicted secreted protein
MAEPLAIPAINTLIQYGNAASPEVFTSIAFVNNITGPSISAQVVDVTSMSSGNAWRQKICTLLEGGEISFDAFWEPMDPTHQTLLTQFSHRGQGSPGIPIDGRMIFPDQDSTAYTFQYFVSKCAISAEVAGVLKAAVTLTITGVISGPGFFPS